jgi:hypothetical protein
MKKFEENNNYLIYLDFARKGLYLYVNICATFI